MIEIVHILQRSEDARGLLPRGTWRDETLDGKRIIVVSCPSCGKVSHPKFNIGFDGVCAWTCSFGCGFFETVMLKDWDMYGKER